MALGITVMLVDDSMTVRKHLGRALTQAGFSVVEAYDGLDALEKLAIDPDVALVLCDLHMPRMGGMDFLERKKSDDRIRAIPSIVVTTEGQAELVHKAKALGARGWMVKPFDTATLVAAVTKLTLPPPPLLDS